ncbi:DUF7033 domain-containing protein [Hymenobacter monticola]|uniref:DUF7033 domain-containing protein n=1 Tax=Hymenobacter monticola TaxID=1705399 RepID=A0ABY4B3R3_9BACT|nr:hypothetical protein [Hymenobacter monticola]UOE33434.1 hypothetical protein MTP16_20200 [Hymenobacter monticola]
MAAPALSAPPLPATPTVTPAVRLAYVLQHFWQAYPAAQQVPIGYEPAPAGVTVLAGAGAFFSGTNPYPPAPHWRDWAGQSIPFFFDAAPGAPLFTLHPGAVTVHTDLISAAFYLLSGWQEYFSSERDRHGRFPYAASVQKQYDFVTVPVVNYYFDVLKTAVEHVSGQKLPPRRWADDAPFGAFITHDIDNLHSAWKAPAKADLKRGNLWGFARKMWQHVTQPDAWDNLEAVAAAVAADGAKSTFFVLPARQPGADGTPNADYRLDDALWNRFHRLAAAGRHEIALHGSIGTAVSATQLGGEAQDFLQARALFPFGNRFHYLRWEPRLTPQLLEAGADALEIGPKYDSTLGFAEHFGFRHSYCHPFYPFNFSTAEAHSFLEIPLNVMDATLHHPHYLQLQADEILPALRPMLQEIERFGGVATVLWHNDHFDPANDTTGPRQFAEIVKHLRQRGAAFLTGWEIWRQFES